MALNRKELAMTEQEFIIHLKVLRAHWHDMTDWFHEAAGECMASFKEDYMAYKEGGPPPDWASYAEEFNDYLREDGMPNLFPTVEECNVHS
jgi:hypothetical protein